MMFRLIREAALDWLFPTRAFCLNCGDPSGQDGDWLCAACRAALSPRLHCVHRDDWPADGVSRAWFALYYEPPVSRLIRIYKYNGVYRLAPFLGECMRPAVEALSSAGFDCVVPVPLHRWRERERGFNQSALLAGFVAGRLELPVEAAVRRTKNTRRQARLPIRLRLGNLRDAFEAVQRLDGQRVLLVDDVFTTGATAHSCARALRQAGAADVQVISVAGSRYYRVHKPVVYHKTARKVKLE